MPAKTTAPNSVGVPKPAVDLTPGTWKYKGTYGGYPWTSSITIKDDGGGWTVTDAAEFPDGPVTDVSTLEKGTLILCKESWKHFPKPGQPWKPVAINLDFTDNKVTGTIRNASGQDKPVAADLGGPVFAGEVFPDVRLGCLPLADGYSTTLRTIEIVTLKENLLQLKVVGLERVTVPAGTFDSWKIELTSADSSYKETVWIAKDSRTPVKASDSEVLRSGVTIFTSAELIP
jgi:hypothetical protein